MRDMATQLGRRVRSDFIPKIVLDRQQRLTSLGRVFDRSTLRQEHIFFNVVTESFEPYSPRNATDPCWIDVTQLLTDAVNSCHVSLRHQRA